MLDIRDAARQSNLVFVHYESDSASANRKLVCSEFMGLDANVLASWSPCIMHQKHLVDGVLLAALPRTGSGSTLAMLTSCSLYLKTPGVWAGVLRRLRSLVRSRACIVVGPPPTQHQGAHEQVLRFLFGRDSWEGDESHGCSSRASSGFDLLLHEVLEVLPGDWLNTTTIPHWCWRPDGSRCCASNEEAIDRMTALLSELVLGRRPTIPIKERWTKTVPCVQWWLRAAAIHGVGLQAIGASATEAREQDMDCQGLQERAILEADRDAGELDFFEVRRSRRERTVSWVSDPTSPVTLVTIMLVLTPLQYLSAWLLKRNSITHKHDVGHTPVLYDLTRTSSSPIVLVLQYLSGLLQSAKYSDSDGFMVWVRYTAAHHCQAVSLLKRLLICAASAIHRRLEAFFEKYPWRIARLADSRSTKHIRWTEANALLHRSCSHCYDQHFTRKLVQSLPSHEPEALLQPDMQFQLHMWVRCVDCNNADVENAHARNKRRASDTACTKAETLAALYVLDESKLNHRALQMVVGSAEAQGQRVALPGCDKSNRSRRSRDGRVGSALVQFHRVRCQLARSRHAGRGRGAISGRPVNPASAAAWADTKRLWAGMTVAEREQYEEAVRLKRLVFSMGSQEAPTELLGQVAAGTHTAVAEAAATLLGAAGSGGTGEAAVPVDVSGITCVSSLGCVPLATANQFPLSPQTLAHHAASNGNDRFDLRGLADSFASRCNSVVVSNNLDNVVYPKACQDLGICQGRNTKATLLMHAALVKWLHTIPSSLGIGLPAAASGTSRLGETLIALEGFNEGNGFVTRNFVLVAGYSRGSNPTVSFLACARTDDSAVEPLALQFPFTLCASRHAHERMDAQSFSASVLRTFHSSTGSLKFLLHTELAAVLAKNNQVGWPTAVGASHDKSVNVRGRPTIKMAVVLCCRGGCLERAAPAPQGLQPADGLLGGHWCRHGLHVRPCSWQASPGASPWLS